MDRKEDRIMRRRDVGPGLKKDKLREGMSTEEAQLDLMIVMGIIDRIKDREDDIKYLQSGLDNMCTKYNISGLNSLLAFLTNKSGDKVKKERDK